MSNSGNVPRVKTKGNSYIQYEWHPTGKVIFRTENRLRTEWGDLKKKLLEEQLPNILAKLELAAKAEETYIEQARLRREEMERQRRQEAERQRRRNEELSAFKKLMQTAERWKKSQVLREYLATRPDIDLDWANQKADWYDPATNADDDWLSPSDRDIL